MQIGAGRVGASGREDHLNFLSVPIRPIRFIRFKNRGNVSTSQQSARSLMALVFARKPTNIFSWDTGTWDKVGTDQNHSQFCQRLPGPII
jgi:hypothetical protein